MLQDLCSVCCLRIDDTMKGYNLSNTGCDDCQQGQYRSHSVELQISHCCNTNTNKEHAKGELDIPTAE
jgi:hypothetical protein